MAMFKGIYLFQTIILGIHVSFRECMLNFWGVYSVIKTKQLAGK